MQLTKEEERLYKQLVKNGDAKIAYICGAIGGLSTFCAVLFGTVGVRMLSRGTINAIHEQIYKSIPEGYVMAQNHRNKGSGSGDTTDVLLYNITRHAHDQSKQQ